MPSPISLLNYSPDNIEEEKTTRAVFQFHSLFVRNGSQFRESLQIFYLV